MYFRSKEWAKGVHNVLHTSTRQSLNCSNLASFGGYPTLRPIHSELLLRFHSGTMIAHAQMSSYLWWYASNLVWITQSLQKYDREKFQ